MSDTLFPQTLSFHFIFLCLKVHFNTKLGQKVFLYAGQLMLWAKTIFSS
ncbi:hypothetical protein HMPREF0653_00461 [Prevotella disiens JCM 6334 = ATCC 29426]|uniref:Uncharacterized protein n=1 Tax=Prevotella disiens JCM 6334 = ATCC 29426 TaxID=1235811 RepID=A0ABN0NUM3_9BACT|nr:hypothetical protein HMPREF0653_00461 [Prevotella disiens JCM 6334 = ATCC 29426]